MGKSFELHEIVELLVETTSVFGGSGGGVVIVDDAATTDEATARLNTCRCTSASCCISCCSEAKKSICDSAFSMSVVCTDTSVAASAWRSLFDSTRARSAIRALTTLSAAAKSTTTLSRVADCFSGDVDDDDGAGGGSDDDDAMSLLSSAALPESLRFDRFDDFFILLCVLAAATSVPLEIELSDAATGDVVIADNDDDDDEADSVDAVT